MLKRKKWEVFFKVSVQKADTNRQNVILTNDFNIVPKLVDRKIVKMRPA